jgi:MFS family permease
MLERKYRGQWYAAIVANLSTFAFGIALGWAAPNIPRLQSTDTPLADKHVLDWNEISWVSSLYLVGGAVSSLFHGWTAERFGRKSTIILTAVSQTVSWLIIEFGPNVYYLYLARFLVGFGGGGCYVTIPVYVNEIASEKQVNFLFL